MKRIVIAGTGFSGSVLARKIVDEFGYDVYVFEKRDHIGGNMYDYRDEFGILIQKYGPHFINTNKYWIIDYLKKYADMVPYSPSLLSYIDGKYIQLPFNFLSLQQLVGPERSESLLKRMRASFGCRDRVPMFELLESNDPEIKAFAQMLFEKAFKTYTSKQWGLPIESIDSSVINRVQFCIGYDKRYLNKDYQYLPKEGFTKMFENILNDKRIHLVTGVDATEHISFYENRVLFDDKDVDLFIFTGGIDELFKYKYGRLPYRTLKFQLNYYHQNKKLPCEIISYPQEKGFTRSTEYKQFTFDCQNTTDTVVVTEYPDEYDPNDKNKNIPCYPVINERNLDLYNRYFEEAQKYNNLVLCGRLAEYKYYNMDLVIESTFERFEQIIRFFRK